MPKKLSPLLKILKSQKHSENCKKGKCVCGLNAAIDEYKYFLQLQLQHIESLQQKILNEE